MLEIVLGSHNQKKLGELRELLAGLPITVASLAEFPQAIQVDETGETFAENARLKAVEQATHLHRWVLAEDSGLTVPALGNQPGVYSARYAGVGASDEANNAKLIVAIKDLPASQRTAYYTCQICLADPKGTVRYEGCETFHGVVTDQPAGTAGFGYDPLFIVPEYHRTVAEMGPMTKRAISHRARVMRRFRRAITSFLFESLSSL